MHADTHSDSHADAHGDMNADTHIHARMHKHTFIDSLTHIQAYPRAVELRKSKVQSSRLIDGSTLQHECGCYN